MIPHDFGMDLTDYRKCGKKMNTPRGHLANWIRGWSME